MQVTGREGKRERERKRVYRIAQKWNFAKRDTERKGDWNRSKQARTHVLQEDVFKKTRFLKYMLTYIIYTLYTYSGKRRVYMNIRT